MRRAARPLSACPDRVRWLTVDFLEWESCDKFDGLAACYFLDCFTPEHLDRIIRKATALCRPGAPWVITDFAVPDSGLARVRALAVHRLMYGFFGLATRLPARRMTAPDPFLTACGFRLVDRTESEWGLLRSDVWRLSS
jgi:hypothetical protein